MPDGVSTFQVYVTCRAWLSRATMAIDFEATDAAGTTCVTAASSGGRSDDRSPYRTAAALGTSARGIAGYPGPLWPSSASCWRRTGP